MRSDVTEVVVQSGDGSYKAKLSRFQTIALQKLTAIENEGNARVYRKSREAVLAQLLGEAIEEQYRRTFGDLAVITTCGLMVRGAGPAL